jgi:hypothetical protein
MKSSRFSKLTALSISSLLCNSSNVFVLDSADKIAATYAVPFAGAGSIIPSHPDCSFNGNDELFVTSNFRGTVNYSDNTGSHSLSSNAGSWDIYVGKYHKCEKYAPMLTQQGDTVKCSLSGFYYQWYYDNDTAQVTAGPEPYFVPSKTGNLRVVVSDTFGCTGISPWLAVTINVQNGISIVPNNVAVQVFPNPTNGAITISGVRLGEPLTISDIVGRPILSVISHGSTETISLQVLVPGVYFLRTNAGSVRIIKRD